MKSHLPGIIFIIGFFITTLATISHYGINEDSPFHLLRGQAYLRLLTTGKKLFDQPRLTSPVLFIPEQRISMYKYNAWESNVAPIRPIINLDGNTTIQERFRRYQESRGRQSFYKHSAWNTDAYTTPGHPPVSDILEAVTNNIFYEKLGIVGDIEGYYLYVVFTAVLALVGIYFFTTRTLGVTQAIFATITLGLYPVFFAESHFNIKDIPELAFFTWSVVSFYFWVTTRKIDWFIIFFLAFFLGVGTKLNIVFLPVVVLPWLLSIRKTEVFHRWFTKKLLIYASVFTIGIISLLILVWPYLWESPLLRLLAVVYVYIGEGSVDLRLQEKSRFLLASGIDLGPLLLLTSQTPIIMLVCWIVGFVGIVGRWIVRKSNLYHVGVLVIFWFAVPLLRVLRPGAETFQVMRSYMEFLPAFAIVAGVGAWYIGMGIQKIWATFIVRKNIHRLPLRYIFSIIGSVYVVFLSVTLIRFHPNQNVYFNHLIGGPRGAIEQGVYSWRTSYQNPFRQAINWLNLNADRGAQLAYLDGTMQAIPSIWLRGDIALSSSFSGIEQKGEYITTLVYPNPPPVFAYMYLARFLEPVYELNVYGLPLVRIYKNDHSYVKTPYKNIVSLGSLFATQSGTDAKLGQYWEIAFDNPQSVVSVKIRNAKGDCSRKEGLFRFRDYLVPLRIDINTEESVYYFPAEETETVRFYGIEANSCLVLGQVTRIEVLGKP